jgi:hypothetical protein
MRNTIEVRTSIAILQGEEVKKSLEEDSSDEIVKE